MTSFNKKPAAPEPAPKKKVSPVIVVICAVIVIAAIIVIPMLGEIL